MLDTNALIWLMAGSATLGEESVDLINQAVLEDSLYVSAISFWEIGMLVAKERIRLDRDMADWHREVLELGIDEIPLTGRMAMLSTTLARLPKDPADRIIVSTAMTIGGRLVTADTRILNWDNRALHRHDARK